MANCKELDLEWTVSIPEGSTISVVPESANYRQHMINKAMHGLLDLVVAIKCKLLKIANDVQKIGTDDPRRLVHGVKVGLALTLVSLFYYMRPLYNSVGGSAMWAVMTVVVIFEYTVGGSLYKGFNRAVATTCAGALAVGIHWMAHLSGETMEPYILGGSVFLLASAATFSRFIPTIKQWFDYGITIFILTYCLVAVSGYRVDELLAMAQNRLSTIVIGVAICLIVCMLVCPVWAGEELHNLIIRNMEKLASSLEGCVAEYFEEEKGKNSPSNQLQGYKCVLNSKASEETQANLARWEPSHGRFSFRYPYNQYVKVGAAMRHCAYCIEALHSCISSETHQAPEPVKKHLKDLISGVSTESSKVLKDLASSITSMKRSSDINILVEEMKRASVDLRNAFGTLPDYLLPNQRPQEENTPETILLPQALSVITVASLLIEISVRINGVADAVDQLAKQAHFEAADEIQPRKTKLLSFIFRQVESNAINVERV